MAAAPTTISNPWAHSFIYGLVPPAIVETQAKCPNGVAKVETQQSFPNGLVSHRPITGDYAKFPEHRRHRLAASTAVFTRATKSGMNRR